MTDKRRVGVIGTLVCDVIYGVPPRSERSEGWGGIGYALTGLDAALSNEWEIVPLIKVGADVAPDAREFIGALRHIGPTHGVREVPEPNNRSELRYYSAEQRKEHMSGGVPGWTWDAMRALLEQSALDALYVNFLSGWELTLSTMQHIRAHFAGPIYVDLHMMLWHPDANGMRTLTPLADAAAWCACFDFIQVNEDEMRMLASDTTSLAQLAVRAGALATLVTLGTRGVSYHAAHGLDGIGDYTRLRAQAAARADGEGADVTHGVLPPEWVSRGDDVDPTGCGDVWGGTTFARLLAGDPLPVALRAANLAAGVNAVSHGVHGLAEKIRAASYQSR